MISQSHGGICCCPRRHVAGTSRTYWGVRQLQTKGRLASLSLSLLLGLGCVLGRSRLPGRQSPQLGWPTWPTGTRVPPFGPGPFALSSRLSATLVLLTS